MDRFDKIKFPELVMKQIKEVWATPDISGMPCPPIHYF